MMNDRDENKHAAVGDRDDDQETSRPKDAEDESSADETGEDETKRFERPDNLRRRSEWFQKRTGGG